MPKKTNIYDEFVGEQKNAKTKLKSLLKAPQKDSKINSPKILNYVENGTHQIDLLYLPTDENGSKYAMVVVDLATGKTDSEPMKARESSDAVNALKKIYGRKKAVLKKPALIQVDDGTEFKKDFIKYLQNEGIKLKVAKAGRSRQMGKVEARNKIIGKMLNMRMLAEEMNTGLPVTNWTKDLPRAIEIINKYLVKKPPEYGGVPRCEGKSCTLLEKGSKVRVIMDKPRDYLSGVRLNGKFRTGDIRFDPTVRTVERWALFPNQPPLYKVSGINNALYTRNQLQVVDDKKKLPSDKYQEKFVIDKIVDKKKIKNLIHYKVHWKGYDSSQDTWESRKKLIKEDLLDYIQDYEQNK